MIPCKITLTYKEICGSLSFSTGKLKYLWILFSLSYMWYFENIPLFSCLKKWLRWRCSHKEQTCRHGGWGGTGRRGRRRVGRIESNMETYIACMPSHQSCPALCESVNCMQPARLLCPWDPPGKVIGVGCRALLQGIFPTQGLKMCLCTSRWVPYHQHHLGSPYSHTHINMHMYVHIYVCVCVCVSFLGRGLYIQ